MNDIAFPPHDDSQQISLRERKKRLAQATIEETALRLFQQKGYEQTSIQDIADAVMISSRTFFRYFASKEEVIFAPMYAIQSEGLHFLEQVAPTGSVHVALKATFEYLASLYQQQRTNFLTRYHLAMQIPSIVSVYLHALIAIEPAMCDTLCSRLEDGTSRHEICLLVAIYMAALRVALLEWLEQEAQGDLVSWLRKDLDAFSSLPTIPRQDNPSS
jgi:AcrR family transcriptional regulator